MIKELLLTLLETDKHLKCLNIFYNIDKTISIRGDFNYHLYIKNDRYIVFDLFSRKYSASIPNIDTMLEYMETECIINNKEEYEYFMDLLFNQLEKIILIGIENFPEMF